MENQKDLPKVVGEMFFTLVDAIMHSEADFFFNDACARNNKENKCVCCVSNHFDLEPAAEGAVKNKRKMLEAVKNLKSNGYNPENFVKSLFLGDNEKAKIALDELMFYHNKKEDGYCLFFGKENKVCTIHPVSIGENIRGSICNNELCKGGNDGYTVLYSIIPVDKMMPAVLLARDNNHKVLGHLQFRYSGVYDFSKDGVDCAVIEGMGVGEEYLRKGIGSNLVKMLEAKAKDKCCEKVITDLYYEDDAKFTDSDIAFFEKLGYSFKESGKRRYFEKNLEYLCLDFIRDGRHPE